MGVRPVGWRGESHRHYLAAKGVSSRSYFMATNVRLPQYQLKEIEVRRGKEAAREARELAIRDSLSARELADLYGVPYVRKSKFGDVPERAYTPGSAAVERLVEGKRGSYESYGGDPVEVVMKSEGRVMGKKALEEAEERVRLDAERVEGVNYDLARGTVNEKSPMYDVYLRRLEAAKVALEGSKRNVEDIKSKLRSGDVEGFVPVREKARIVEISIGPKRAAAVEDAKSVPVLVGFSEGLEGSSLKGKDVKPSVQTRVSKFFKLRVVPG